MAPFDQIVRGISFGLRHITKGHAEIGFDLAIVEARSPAEMGAQIAANALRLKPGGELHQPGAKAPAQIQRRNLAANIDMALAALTLQFKLPTSAPFTLFAMARMA
jgi:hypothetical protein